MVTTYHVFTNNNDDWFNTLKDAEEAFQEFKKDYGCARLYEEIWENSKEDSEPMEENCLKSYGGFPS